MVDVTGRDRRLDRALQQFRLLNHEIAREVGLARVNAGVSQDAAGASVGMSGSQFGRIERAELRSVTVEQWCRATAAVGLRLHVRAYPDGDPLRDAPQTRLLERFRGACIPPFPCTSRFRCTAGRIREPGTACSTCPPSGTPSRPRRAFATVRRCGGGLPSKRRDDPTISHVFLLVADTPANRRAIGEVRELLRPTCRSIRGASSRVLARDVARAPAGSCSAIL